jgi:Mg-chelatase subunit ChlD
MQLRFVPFILLLTMVLHGQTTGAIKVDYQVMQVDIPASEKSQFHPGEAYAQIGFHTPASNLVNIDEIPEAEALVPSSCSTPKNICFVLDVSGSMSDVITGGTTKLDWVKEVCQVLIDMLDEKDSISIVIFNHETSVIMDSRLVKDDNARIQFIKSITALYPSGGTYIAQGLSLGYEQVKKNYQSGDCINRVILLTDGRDYSDKGEVLDMVKNYTLQNISTASTIALTNSADKDFMTQIAQNGGGLSIFIDQYESPGTPEFKNKLKHLLASSQADLQETWNMHITLNACNDVQLTEASQECTKREGTVADYQLVIKSGEYKTIWIQLYLSDKAMQADEVLHLFLQGYDSQGRPISGDYSLSIRVHTPETVVEQNIQITSVLYLFP